MKNFKKKFAWVLAFLLAQLFSLNMLLTQELPYPIILIHGLGSNYLTWSDEKNGGVYEQFIAYGWRDGGPIHVTLDYNRNSVNKLDSKEADVLMHTSGLQPADFYSLNFDVDATFTRIATSGDNITSLDRGASSSDLIIFPKAIAIFRAGDIIRIDDEFLQVEKIEDDKMMVIRGLFGSQLKRYISGTEILNLSNQSNQASIAKQAFGLKMAIDLVKQVNSVSRVILVGHSMGGLAARRYLQDTEAYQADVASLVTIGTPHLGSDISDVSGILDFLKIDLEIDLRSDAVRDLRYSKVRHLEKIAPFQGYDDATFLFGGFETIPYTQFQFYNYDFNADGTESQNPPIQGLHYETLPANLQTTWIVSKDTDDGDRVVQAARQYYWKMENGQEVIYGDTLWTEGQHLEETTNARAIVRGLDEPEDLLFGYEIAINQKFQAFVTISPYDQGYSTVVDRDAFYFVFEQPGSIELQLESIPFSNTAPTTTVQLFNKSDLNTPIASATNQIGSRSLKLIHTNLQADTYYVRTVLAADANSWQTPYTIEVNKLSAPINLFSYADLSVLPADGSTANIFAELRMPNGNRHPTANNPVTFTITSGASSGILVGSNPVNATNGIASIQLLSTTTPGQVMIEASSPGLASSTTSVFVFGNPTPVSGTIRNNTTWTLTNSPYDVTGDIVIAQGVTLTIEPGVTVRFNSERDIYVDGALVANGTASQKIVFTANSSTPFAGLWGGVKFNNSSISNISILNHCQFLYGGQAFRSEDAPIVLNARANPTITNTSLLNNKRNGIHIVEGTYNSNINLNITGIPYFFTNNDIVVATGFTMTVSPGVIIKFGSERDLYVDGALVADGTPSQPIIFTAYADDAHGGDTNGDGPTFPPPGSWGGVKFNISNLGSTSVLDNCQFFYAGQNFRSEASPITIHGRVNPRITQTTLASNKRNGIRLIEGTYTAPVLLDVVGIPYFISFNDVVIAPGVKMAIKPGVIVKFGSERDIHINGALEARGTTAQPIVFTSIQDDGHGGDTNGDGITSPEAGNWGGIRFNDSSIDNQSALEYCEIYYGGQNFRSEPSPLTINGRINPRITQTTLASNKRNGIRLVEGTYNAPVLLDVVGIPYFIEFGDVVIAPGVKMAIKPGVIVKLGSERDLHINGALEAKGAVSQPIVFTSMQDDARGGDTNGDGETTPLAGNWGGVRFNDSVIDNQSALEYCEFYYGGQGFRSESSPLTVDPRIQPDMATLTLADNKNNGIDLIGGTFNAHLFLETIGTPYTLRFGDITVSQGTSMTISPGVLVKFGSERDLHIRGALIANGTAESPIILTSMKDDANGGDTNGNDESIGLPGDWGGIKFYDTSDDQITSLNFCRIAFGGQGFRSEPNPLVFEGASPKIQNTVISDSRSHGVNCGAMASPDFGGGSHGSVGQNSFFGFLNNANKFAFHNDGAADIFAKMNYWETTDLDLVRQNIYDFFDNAAKGKVLFEPIKDISTSVNLLALAATVNKTDVELTWTASTTLSISSLEVERSKDGVAYERIGFVETFVAETGSYSYSFIDKNVPVGEHYYRLKHIDANGSTRYSDAIHITIGPPSEFFLSQNYPNPFTPLDHFSGGHSRRSRILSNGVNPETTIDFALPEPDHVTLTIYNTLGQVVRVVVDEKMPAGNWTVKWDGRDRNNQPVPSGIYLYRMVSGKFAAMRKLMVVR